MRHVLFVLIGAAVTTCGFAALAADAGMDGGVADPCNGIDDDGDGVTDEFEDPDCPNGLCVGGECVELCVGTELSCPVGQICKEVQGEKVCITDVCNPQSEDALPCADNPYWCDEGFAPPCACDAVSKLCADSCHGVECDQGDVCVPKDGGKCHATGENCYVAGCPAGSKCVDDTCVDDLCADATCTAPQYCNAQGECVDPCVGMDCPNGCYEGECVDDKCAGVECGPGLTCNPSTGNCEQGDCWNVPCEFWEVCVDGQCVDDPCWNVNCPNGLECLDGACHDYEGPADQPDSGADTDADTDGDSGVDGGSDTDTGTTVDAGPDAGQNAEDDGSDCGCKAAGARDRVGLAQLLLVLLP
jgi:hypothetical protein